MNKHCVPIWVVVVTSVVLMAGNYFYQSVFQETPNWGLAAERSWFQSVALFIAWLTWKT